MDLMAREGPCHTAAPTGATVTPRPHVRLKRLVDLVILTSRIYTRPTDRSMPVQPAAPYEVRPATPADLARFASDLGHELRPGKAALIRARAEDPQVELFVAALPDGTLCGFGHVEFGRVRDAHLRVDLGPRPSTAHLFDDFVSPTHRGHRLQGALVAARVSAAAERGATVASILVEDSNHASRASVRRAGFAPAQRVITLRLGRPRMSWVHGS